MMRHYTVAVAGLLGSAVVPGSYAYAGNLVANPGFEDVYYQDDVNPFPSAWTVTGDAASDNGYPNTGAWDVYLGGGATVGQTLTTVAGALYTISFYLTNDVLVNGDFAASFDLTFGGADLPGLAGTPITGPTIDAFYTYQEFTYIATATATSTDLVFSAVTSYTGEGNWYLDDVSVTAVPEPAAAALLISALGGLVLVRWRRGRDSNPGYHKGTTVFETAPIDRSGTSP